MSKDCNHSNILLKRNGTNQNQRHIDALDPGSVKLHDLSIEDWMAFAHAFAESVNFFSTDTNEKDGKWEAFFTQKDAIKELLAEAKIKKDLTPNITLFVCFLQLIRLSQKRLNNLSKRHLDFYYKDVLKLSNKDAVADQVHLLFELAKNASDVRVKEQTAVDAAKDADGNKRIYKTQNELIVNSAQVASVKNILHTENENITYSEVANSFDGLGEDFPDDNIKWWPFGHPNFKDSEDFPNLPNAKLGFAIASPILLLKEGERFITFTITFKSKPTGSLSANDFENGLDILLSGQEEWIPAIVDTTESSLSGKKLTIKATLTAAADAVVPYNKEVLLENFNSSSPVARFLFKTGDDTTGYKLYNILNDHEVSEIKIDVDVNEMQELVLENDLGRLDVSKPFLPFGPQPVRDSKLYIGCQEALNKPWTEVSIDLSWKDTPFFGAGLDQFKEHYKAYRNNYLNNLGKQSYNIYTTYHPDSYDGGLIVSSSDDFEVNIETLNDKNWELKAANEILFKPNDNGTYSSQLDITNQIKSESAPKSKTTSKRMLKGSSESILGFGKINDLANNSDFIKAYGKNPFFGFEASIMDGIQGMFDNPIQQESFSSNAKKGFIRLSLQQSFLHDLFPKIYAIALSKQDVEAASGGILSALVPNEPYTPLVETIRINYSATVTKSFKLDDSEANLKENLTDYLDESLELFHENPFGQSEQHTYLKSKHEFLTNKQCKLLPNLENGELFIGIENAEQLQQISLLIQVLEGSENPEYEGAQTFEGNEKLEWYILSNDEWKPLNDNFIISNGTDNFLKSGIVKVSIPKEATKNNNRIPGDLFWLKVHNVKEFDTVCQMVNVHTQAEVAQFYNDSNELSHLETGLPEETISKLVERIATLKGVTQPYSSFGGVPKETDSQFYRRISERLRHKQRAITIWDYEQLILQQFPKIYKVNCLKHTLGLSELVPGAVTVIVVPNIIDQNIFDIYKPRISKAKRNEIQNFINELNTLHVNALVENPLYQEVRVELFVKFHEGKDKNFYTKELKKDIAKFLSPWAYEETAEINFGLTLHESTVIYYIEQLGYVDYIKGFELQAETKKKDVYGNTVYDPVKTVVPANSKVILTSVKLEQHIVKPIDIEECVVV